MEIEISAALTPAEWQIVLDFLDIAVDYTPSCDGMKVLEKLRVQVREVACDNCNTLFYPATVNYMPWGSIWCASCVERFNTKKSREIGW